MENSKKVFAGIGVFVLGFLITSILSNIWGDIPAELTYLYGIIFSILYLASVVTICCLAIIKELRRLK